MTGYDESPPAASGDALCELQLVLAEELQRDDVLCDDALDRFIEAGAVFADEGTPDSWHIARVERLDERRVAVIFAVRHWEGGGTFTIAELTRCVIPAGERVPIFRRVRDLLRGGCA